MTQRLDVDLISFNKLPCRLHAANTLQLKKDIGHVNLKWNVNFSGQIKCSLVQFPKTYVIFGPLPYLKAMSAKNQNIRFERVRTCTAQINA